MKKILAFAGSNSTTSINQRLVHATSELIDFAEVNVINLRNYNAPMFGVDLEAAEGAPQAMKELAALIDEHDAFIISTPEHNSMPPAFFLNVIDWLSRINRSIFSHKPVLLMSTSPGARAGVSALAILEATLPRFAGDVAGVYSLPSFNENFKDQMIHNETEMQKLKQQIQAFKLKIIQLEEVKS